MTMIEMKYSLFKDIDSISDESLLYKLTTLVKNFLMKPINNTEVQVDTDEIPEFIRNMSVRTGMTGNEDVKELNHMHWEEKYG